MPFTPFHMGPGLALKMLAGDRFSVLGFGFAQIAIDIEPLLGLIYGWDVLHGRTHSVLGATLIGLVVTAVTPVLARPLLRLWNGWLREEGMDSFTSTAEVSWLAASSGALLGVWTHVLLDGAMHADLLPLWPWSGARPLLDTLSMATLHLACVATGLAGVAAWFWRGWRRRRRAVRCSS